ncbi:hypothetical protein Bca4012_050537 [Brassica carinata]
MVWKERDARLRSNVSRPTRAIIQEVKQTVRLRLDPLSRNMKITSSSSLTYLGSWLMVKRGGLNPAKKGCEGTVQSLEAPEPELSQHGEDSFDRRDGVRPQDQMRSVSPTEPITEKEMDKT